MGGPAGVGDAGVGVEDFGEIGLALLDQLLELDHLANLFESHDLVALVAVDGKASRIIAAVLEALKT